MTPIAKPVWMALFSAALFGAATPLSKALLDDCTPFQLAGLLYLGAALAVAPLALRSRSRTRWNLANLRKLIGAIACGGVFGPLLLLFSLQTAPASSVSLWLNLELVATALIGHFLFHDHMERGSWIALSAMVIAGMLLCVGQPVGATRSAVLVALACICWAIDNHLTALIDGISPAQSTFWKGLLAGTVNMAIGLGQAEVAGLSFQTVIGGLIVGQLCYGASIALYIAAAQQIGATRGQMIFATAPFIGMTVSIVWLDEPVTSPQVIAGALFVLALIALFRERHGHRHEHAALAHTHAHRHDDGHHLHPHVGDPPANYHSHWHEHEATVHTHPHWPDLHHRHAHRQHE